MVGLDGSCVSSRRTDLRLARRQERTDQPKKQAEKRAKVLALENFSVLSGFALSDLLSSEKTPKIPKKER